MYDWYQDRSTYLPWSVVTIQRICPQGRDSSDCKCQNWLTAWHTWKDHRNTVLMRKWGSIYLKERRRHSYSRRASSLASDWPLVAGNIDRTSSISLKIWSRKCRKDFARHASCWWIWDQNVRSIKLSMQYWHQQPSESWLWMIKKTVKELL